MPIKKIFWSSGFWTNAAGYVYVISEVDKIRLQIRYVLRSIRKWIINNTINFINAGKSPKNII